MDTLPAFTTILTSVCVEYVTDAKRIHTTGRDSFVRFRFLSLAPSRSLSVFLALSARQKKITSSYLVISQTPCTQIEQAAASEDTTR